MYPFTKGSFAPRNAWYVAAFANEVGEHLLARTFLNQPVVLYRKADGQAVAVGGRCPHRHFPLGASQREGDAIVCGYHGITFGADGRCTRIPSQAHVPSSYRIPTFPLVELGVWLFIWMGDPEKADPELLPTLADIGFHDTGHAVHPMHFHEIGCRYQLLNDNLLDLTHLSFLHAASSGSIADAETPEEHTIRPGFIGSRRVMQNQLSPAILRKTMPDLPERVDRVSEMDFYLPGFHAGISDVTTVAEAGTVVKLHSTRLYHCVTPSTPGQTYYWFAASSRDDDVDAHAERVKSVIAEDIFASEEIEKMLRLLDGSPSELMIRTDKGAVQARRMLQEMMDVERAQAG